MERAIWCSSLRKERRRLASRCLSYRHREKERKKEKKKQRKQQRRREMAWEENEKIRGAGREMYGGSLL